MQTCKCQTLVVSRNENAYLATRALAQGYEICKKIKTYTPNANHDKFGNWKLTSSWSFADPGDRDRNIHPYASQAAQQGQGMSMIFESVHLFVV